MSTPQQQAAALHTYADLLPELPSRDYEAHALYTYVHFRTEEDRQEAVEIFRREGHHIETDTAGNTTAYIGGAKFWTAGLTINLHVPSIDKPDY